LSLFGCLASSQPLAVEKVRNSFVAATIFHTGPGFGEAEWTQRFPALTEVWRHRLRPDSGVAGSARIRSSGVDAVFSGTLRSLATSATPKFCIFSNA